MRRGDSVRLLKSSEVAANFSFLKDYHDDKSIPASRLVSAAGKLAVWGIAEGRIHAAAAGCRSLESNR
jgi:hypothetical protein